MLLERNRLLVKKEIVGKKETASKPRKAFSFKGKSKDKTPELSIEDGASTYVPEWSICKKASLKKPFICHESIYHLATPTNRAFQHQLSHDKLEIVKGQCALDKLKLIELEAVVEGESQKGLEPGGLKRELAEEVLRLAAGKRSFREVEDLAAPDRDVGSFAQASGEALKKKARVGFVEPNEDSPKLASSVECASFSDEDPDGINKF
ncbi:hypothetical protein L1987_40125 [Smallanthus sonchifolius]|uniref:Uncharacterized protein n=1 Tax=Smallanthus sonchifolius TaxID=185202 RepID=A0ACB9GTZ5_9ASTR|nr:hypothetical protein L1987_40125 [Smallanthus sonchifolius]